VTTSGPLLDIDMSEVIALQRELRAVSKDFANAMTNELRQPVQDFANELKLSARVNLPSWDRIGSNAAAGVRSTSSSKSGYSVKRENERARGFTQMGYADRTGKIRHPLYGNRDYWYENESKSRDMKGWWSKVVEDRLPEKVDEFTAAMLRIMDRLATGNLSTRSIATGKTRTKTVL
jgi:hypothetical protein